MALNTVARNLTAMCPMLITAAAATSLHSFPDKDGMTGDGMIAFHKAESAEIYQ